LFIVFLGALLIIIFLVVIIIVLLLLVLLSRCALRFLTPRHYELDLKRLLVLRYVLR
jgi:hypothetical protein